jgi:NADP-dependent 3-hydroxy acid dehydrogenase YdfG
MNRFANKAVLVTGGSSGIGLAAAQAFAAEGARVVITGRDAAALEQAKAQIGGRTLTLQLDSGSLSAAKELARGIADHGIKLDAVFINAGVAKFAPLDQVDEALWDLTFNSNVKGAYFQIQALLPLLNHGASIILNGSINAGDPIVLLHGYAETSHMWRPLIAETCGGQSYGDRAGSARLRRSSTRRRWLHQGGDGARRPRAGQISLKYPKVKIVGHDIGLMVAYAYAAQYPSEVDRIALMDAFLPGVGDWTHVWLLRDLWHFHFYGKTPLALVRAASAFTSSTSGMISPRTRRSRCRKRTACSTPSAYAKPGHMACRLRGLPRFEKDAAEFAELAKTKLPMPMLVLSGEKAGGSFPDRAGALVASNVDGVIVKGAGHWLMEEAVRAGSARGWRKSTTLSAIGAARGWWRCTPLSRRRRWALPRLPAGCRPCAACRLRWRR